MATIVTREVGATAKGSPLTNAEVDANFTNLNTDKSEKAANLSDLTDIAQAKTNLGLGNVNNTADTAKPVSTAQQTALNLKANTASPALTGTPTAPTATAGTNTTQLATTAFVTAAVSGVAGAAHTHAIADVSGLQTALDGKQMADADLTAIAGLAGTSGFLKKTAANTWSLDTASYITGNQSVTVSGDATGTGTTAISLTLANSGVTGGTYKSVTVDAKGRVTAGTNPTTLAGYGITNAVSASSLGVANGVATLDPTGRIPTSQLPSGGVTSIIAGTGITISSTGPGGTDAVTVSTSGGGGGASTVGFEQTFLFMGA